MKSIRIKLVLVILSMLVFFSCQDNTELKTILPDEIAENKEVVEYFKTLESVVEDFEKIHEVASGYDIKDMSLSDFTMSDVKAMFRTFKEVDVVSLVRKAKKLEKDTEYLKENMSEEEIEAFTKTYSDLVERMSQLKIQYE